jgi:catechol 2,3-dioxygenase-like lactoylglutathione lyase family enzyme
MKLNHLNLTVSDVDSTSAFFETYFGFSSAGSGGNNMLAVLYGRDGFILTLMSEAFNKNGLTEYPEAFHFGFILPSATEVSELYQQLKAGGIAVGREPTHIRGSFGFYFYFDKLFIEIGYYAE